MKVSRGRGTRMAGIGIAIAITAALLPASAPAGVLCGDVVAQDITLQADLDCSASATPALTVAADGVEIDLNGHKITGPATQNGIHVPVAYDRLTVKDGSIVGYNHAIVMLAGGRDLRLANLKLNVAGSNAMGAELGGLRHARLSGLRIRNPNYGLYIFESKDVVVKDSRIRGGNATGQIIGINQGNNSGTHTGAIRNVIVRGTTYGFYIYGATPGFEITDSSANGNSYVGFYVVTNDPSPFQYILRDNTANNNDEYGFYAGQRVPVSSGNRATGNGTRDCRKVPRCNRG